MWKRLATASMCVLALLAFPAASAVLPVSIDAHGQSHLVQSDAQASSESRLFSYYTSSASTPEALFERIAGVHSPSPIPENFCEEFFDPYAWGSVQVYAGDGVLGLCWDASLGVSEAALYDALGAKGWQRIGATDLTSSFIKEDGVFRWSNIQCFETESYVSIVIAYGKET